MLQTKHLESIITNTGIGVNKYDDQSCSTSYHKDLSVYRQRHPCQPYSCAKCSQPASIGRFAECASLLSDIEHSVHTSQFYRSKCWPHPHTDRQNRMYLHFYNPISHLPNDAYTCANCDPGYVYSTIKGICVLQASQASKKRSQEQTSKQRIVKKRQTTSADILKRRQEKVLKKQLKTEKLKKVKSAYLTIPEKIYNMLPETKTSYRTMIEVELRRVDDYTIQ